MIKSMTSRRFTQVNSGCEWMYSGSGRHSTWYEIERMLDCEGIQEKLTSILFMYASMSSAYSESSTCGPEDTMLAVVEESTLSPAFSVVPDGSVTCVAGLDPDVVDCCLGDDDLGGVIVDTGLGENSITVIVGLSAIVMSGEPSDGGAMASWE